ncbi:MAG: DUF421 domain-containing protein [Bacillota bacterium]|nr:DUF421 domain-containing protein [Bacillota bacterium]
MTIILIRTVILYLVVLFVIRIMGKAELSKMSPFQLIVVFMIAELASIPIETPDVSILTGVTAIFTLLLLQVLISYLSIKSEKFKNFFNGKPSVLVDKGDINQKELKKLRITINDLMEQLRIGNTPSISDVEYAIMESNGDLSIIPKAEKKPLTPEDMSLPKEKEIMPVVFISDGILYRKNIQKAGWNEKQLADTLSSLSISNYTQVFLAFCDEQSKLHVFLTNKENTAAREVTS